MVNTHHTDAAQARFDPKAAGAARHGVDAPRGQSAVGSRGGRFTRMFGSLPSGDLPQEALAALAARLKVVKGDSALNTAVPAGYTYLGQFIDHDITFDPTSKLQRDNDPHALDNFRTPRFDLDSVYGTGPADQPFLYDWEGDDPGVKLLEGRNPTGPPAKLAKIDLQRNAQGRALIADARNDENLIVSQLHLLFLQFHNKVVSCVRSHDTALAGERPCHQRLTANELFDEAQRIVRWHYQWIVIHDFLRRIVGRTMAAAVLGTLVEGRGITRQGVDRRIYRRGDRPAIPVEFSAAAYRFGHSMVRRDYTVNKDDLAGHVILPLPCPHPPGTPAERDLGGFRWLPHAAKIEWRRFFGPKAALGDARVLDSMAINHSLAAPLFTLPPDCQSLPLLNLRRGRALGLPSGTDVALALGQEPLDERALFPDLRINGVRVNLWPDDVEPKSRAAVLRSPPLWFYLLREADVNGDGGKRLGPIGGRIVAEVLVGLLEGDPQSYLRRQPRWAPREEAEVLRIVSEGPFYKDPEGGPGSGIFTMADLVEFTAPPA